MTRTLHTRRIGGRFFPEAAGGLALQPEVKRGWKTYNFEVETYHTYVAGGVSVAMNENSAIGRAAA